MESIDDEEKKKLIVDCQGCDSNLSIPPDYHGIFRCPRCGRGQHLSEAKSRTEFQKKMHTIGSSISKVDIAVSELWKVVVKWIFFASLLVLLHALLANVGLFESFVPISDPNCVDYLCIEDSDEAADVELRISFALVLIVGLFFVYSIIDVKMDHWLHKRIWEEEE